MAIDINAVAELMQCINELWPLKYIDADGNYPADINQVKCMAGATFPPEFWSAVASSGIGDAMDSLDLSEITDLLDTIIMELQDEPQIEATTLVVCDTTTGDPLIVHSIYDEEAGTLSYIDQAGAAVNQTTFTACPANRDYEIKQFCYMAIANSGTYSIGDKIYLCNLYDLTGAVPLNPIATSWFNVNNQASIVAPAPADIEPCINQTIDTELERWCDYNPATNLYTAFIRQLDYRDGVVATIQDFQLDGATPYVVVGEIRECPVADVELLRLCDYDVTTNTHTPFLRRYNYDLGSLDGFTDTELDGVTDYTITGTVVVCPNDFEVNDLCDVSTVTSIPVIGITNDILLGLGLSVDGSNHDAFWDDDIVRYEVLWGDGNSEFFEGDTIPPTIYNYNSIGFYTIDIIAFTESGNELCYQVTVEITDPDVIPTVTIIAERYTYQFGVPFKQHVDVVGTVLGTYENDYSAEYVVQGEIRDTCPVNKCDRPKYEDMCCGEVCYRCFTTFDLETTNNITVPTDFGFYDTASADKWDETNAANYWVSCDSAYPLTLRLDTLQVNNIDIVIPGSETLTINSEADLIIEGGAIKNVSNWLNNLPGVYSQGIHFENFAHRISFPDGINQILVQICEIPCNGQAAQNENRKYAAELLGTQFQYVGSVSGTYGLPIDNTPFVVTPGIIGVADPFDSDDPGFYQVINNANIGGVIPGAGLYRYNVDTESYDQIGTPNTTGVTLNAAGYNAEDNFIYCLPATAPAGSQDALGNTINQFDLLRIDRDGEIFRVAPTAIPISVNTGYVWNGNLLVDITNNQFTYIDIPTGNTIWNINLTPAFNPADFVIINDVVYGTANITLTSIDIFSVDISGTITTGDTRTVVTNTIPLTGSTGAGTGSGAAWVSSNPTTGEFELYVNNNTTGDIIQVTGFETPATATAEVIAASIPTGSNDGANNVLAPSPFVEPEVGNIIQEEGNHTYEVDCIEQNKAKTLGVKRDGILQYREYRDLITNELIDPSLIEPCKNILTVENVCDRIIRPNVRVQTRLIESPINNDGASDRWDNPTYRDSFFSPNVTPPVIGIEYRLTSFFVDGQEFATGQSFNYPLDEPRLRLSEIDLVNTEYQRISDWLNGFQFVKDYGITFYDNVEYFDYNTAYPFFLAILEVVTGSPGTFLNVGAGLGRTAISAFGLGGYLIGGVATAADGIDPTFVDTNFTRFENNPFQNLS